MSTIRVGAYFLQSGHVSVDFPDLFQKLIASPNDETRAVFVRKECPIRPTDKIDVLPDYCLADFVRIKNVDFMRLTSLAGKTETLTFEPDQPKPSSETAFVIDHHCKPPILYIQSQEEGVTAAMIAKYFREITGAPFRTELVLHRDAMVQFARQKRFTALKIRLSGIRNAQFLRDYGLSDKAILSIIDQYNNTELELSIGLKKTDRGTLSHIVETVSSLVGLGRKAAPAGPQAGGEPGATLTKLESMGSESPDTPDFPVDFIEGHIHTSLQLEERKPNDGDRYRAVVEAWREYHQDLRERYPAST